MRYAVCVIWIAALTFCRAQVRSFDIAVAQTVLLRNAAAFQVLSAANKLSWPAPSFTTDT